MRVLFTVLGGPTVGMGHVTRSCELAAELRRSGAEVVGVIANADAAVAAKCRSEGVRFLALGKSPEAVARGVETQRADVLVIDRPGSVTGLTRRLKRRFPGLFIVALDNFSMTDPNLDLVINLKNHNRRHGRPTARSVRYYEGVEFGIVRRGFDPYRRRPKKTRETAEDVLVSFGGSDPRQLTVRVLEALQRQRWDGRLRVVAGAGVRHSAAIRSAAARCEMRTSVDRNVRRMEALMQAADFGLIGGGTTMLEMAAVGTPAVVIPQSAAEARFARAFRKAGAFAVLRRHPSAAEIRAAFRRISRPEARRTMSRAARQLVDGQGRTRIVSLIHRHHKEFMRTHA